MAVETEEGVGCLGASQERVRGREVPLPENYRHDCILYPPLAREPLEARAYLPNLFCLLRKVHPTRMAFWWTVWSLRVQELEDMLSQESGSSRDGLKGRLVNYWGSAIPPRNSRTLGQMFSGKKLRLTGEKKPGGWATGNRGLEGPALGTVARGGAQASGSRSF